MLSANEAALLRLKDCDLFSRLAAQITERATAEGAPTCVTVYEPVDSQAVKALRDLGYRVEVRPTYTLVEW